MSRFLKEAQRSDGFDLLVRAEADDERYVQKIYTVRFGSANTAQSSDNSSSIVRTKAPLRIDQTGVDVSRRVESANDSQSTTKFTLSQDQLSEEALSRTSTTLSSSSHSTIEDISEIITSSPSSSSSFLNENNDSSAEASTALLEVEQVPKIDAPKFSESASYTFVVDNPEKDLLIGTLKKLQQGIDVNAPPPQMIIEPAEFGNWFHVDPRVSFG